MTQQSLLLADLVHHVCTQYIATPVMSSNPVRLNRTLVALRRRWLRKVGVFVMGRVGAPSRHEPVKFTDLFDVLY